MRFCLCLCTLLVLFACKKKDDRSTLDKVLERGVLRVGCEPEFAPFETRNEKGEFVGFDMDMARELAKDLGVKLEITAMKWVSLPTALGNDEIDIIISGMTIKPERAKNRSFTDPYFQTGLCLLVNVNSGIASAADVGSKRLVVKRGTTGESAAKELFPDAELIVLQKEGQCALDVVNGRADAFLYDQLSIIKHAKTNSKTTRALLKTLTKEPYAMAVKLGDQKFVDRLNKFLADIKADGRHAALREKYLKDLPDDVR